MLEGRKFRIFTDQRPLTSAFLKAKEPVSNRQRNQLAFISEFCTDMAHVPGLKNVVADALTRQHDDSVAIVNTVAHRLADVDLEQLASDQQSDQDCQSTGSETSLRVASVPFPGVRQHLLCDTSQGRPRIIVPAVWRQLVFRAVHGLAHPSGKTTLAMLLKSYVWKGARRDVLQWSRACDVCARNKVSRHTRPEVRPITAPMERFEHVHVDLVGPFPSDQGCRHILTAIDRTTRWPEAVPIKDSKAETVAQAFVEHWIARFGVPKVVTSDRGAQFTSDLWKTTLSRLGISANTTTAYHPQSNGVVERFHRTLKNALRCVATNGAWVKALPWVLLGLRNAPKDDTRTSTAEVLYGAVLRIPGMCFPTSLGQTSEAKEQLERARCNTRSFTPAVMNGKKFQQSPFIAKQLKDAAYVYVRDDTLAKPALAPRYFGPYAVLERNMEQAIFKLQLPRGPDWVSLSRLKTASPVTS